MTSLRRFCARVAEDGTAGSARYNVFNATDNVSFDFRNATYVGGDASALLPTSGGGAHVSLLSLHLHGSRSRRLELDAMDAAASGEFTGDGAEDGLKASHL